MKKIISYILLLAMCLALFAGCAKTEADPNLAQAAAYIKAMYISDGEILPVNYKVVSSTKYQDVVYTVEWTTDAPAELVKIVANSDNTVSIVTSTESSEEVAYTLTATVKDANGFSETITFKHKIPKAESAETILNAAYALEKGASLEGVYTLTGVIKTIDTPYDSSFKNVTVTIQVGNYADKPMKCYRMKGEGADNLKIGDTITVTGTITNYNGTIEFAAGCEVSNIVAGNVEQPKVPVVPENATQEEIVNIAYTLLSGQALEGTYTLTGVITSVDTPYDAGFQNVTVTIQVGNLTDKLMKCYRMKGEGADALAVGDTITVTGAIKNYSNTIEFDAGCQVSNIVKGEGTPSTPTTPDTPSNPGTGKPADVTLKTGDKVVIYAPAYNKALSSLPASEGSYYQKGVDITASGSTVSGYANTEVWNVAVNSDGSYSFSYGGKNLGMQDSFASMSLGSVNDKWELTSLGNGLYLIKNTVRGNYIEWYSSKNNWSSYTPSDPASDDQFQLAFYIVK